MLQVELVGFTVYVQTIERTVDRIMEEQGEFEWATKTYARTTLTPDTRPHLIIHSEGEKQKAEIAARALRSHGYRVIIDPPTLSAQSALKSLV